MSDSCHPLGSVCPWDFRNVNIDRKVVTFPKSTISANFTVTMYFLIYYNDGHHVVCTGQGRMLQLGSIERQVRTELVEESQKMWLLILIQLNS